METERKAEYEKGANVDLMAIGSADGVCSSMLEQNTPSTLASSSGSAPASAKM